METDNIVSLFDMSKTTTTADNNDHDYIRFAFDVKDCAVEVSGRKREKRTEKE